MKRKPHSMRARLERSCRALVSTNHAAVVNIDPAGLQFLINLKNCRQITSRPIVDAVCDITHRVRHGRRQQFLNLPPSGIPVETKQCQPQPTPQSSSKN